MKARSAGARNTLNLSDLSVLFIALGAAGCGLLGAAATYVVLRRKHASRNVSARDADPDAVARVDAHRGAVGSTARLTPATSTALGREAQERFESREAARDQQILERLLRDIQDLTSADEVIYWRWVELRQTLVPGVW